MYCVVCGKEFVQHGRNQKTCSPECSHKRDLEMRREYKRYVKEHGTVSTSINKACKGCKYAIKACGGYACDYMQIEGHRRPCVSAFKTGKKCAVYKPMKVKRHYVPSFS